MILVGELALWVALLMAAWGAIVSFAGGRADRPELIASGERAVYATFACVVLATAGLTVALVTSDFSFAHVASFTSANLPVAYKLVALWEGQGGSLLLWTFLLSTCAAIAIATSGAHNRSLVPYVTGTLSVVMLFLLAMTCFGANPYERLPVIPPDGRGLSPHLQSGGTALHPPSLYLGYVATAVPFAFAIGALLAGELDDRWRVAVRRWSLFAWFVLTIGMITGMWWAYVEQGGSGDWAWDAVRNASVLPWLAVTTLLYVMVREERNAVPRKVVVILAASSFLLAVVAAFTTRAGIISSVNAFARSDTRAWSAIFVTASAAAVAYLVATRLRSLRTSAHVQPSTGPKGELRLDNRLLVGISLAMISGTLLPLMMEGMVRGTTTRVRADSYGVVALGLSAFMLGVIVRGLLRATSVRRRSTGEATLTALGRLAAFHRRDYGGFAARVGVLSLAIAFAGFAFRTESSISLGSGESATLVDPYGRPWTFASQGVSDFEELNRHVLAVPVRATRDGQPVGLIRSERRQYIDSRGNPTFEPATEPGILSSLRLDTYVVLANAAEDRAELRIAFNPLVMWVWVGGAIIAIGGLMALGPPPQRSEA